MRIAMVSENADPTATDDAPSGGSQGRHVDRLATGLTDLGHEVVVFTTATARIHPATSPVGYSIVRLRGVAPGEETADAVRGTSPQFARDLEWELAAGRFDVAHAHFWSSAWATRRAARALGLPWAVTFHSLGSVERRRHTLDDPEAARRVAAEAVLADDADLVLALSRAHQLELATLGVDGSHVIVIGVALDPHDFQPRPAIADALGQLLVDQTPLQRYATGELRTAQTRTCWERACRRTAEALASVCDHPPPRLPGARSGTA
jgi:D-inositol-3-phosphate glycosyltransferase